MASVSFHKATQIQLPMYTTNGSTNFDVSTVLLVQFIIHINKCKFLAFFFWSITLLDTLLHMDRNKIPYNRPSIASSDRPSYHPGQ